MVKCSQCGKPAIMVVGEIPLCVDCNLKLQQAMQMQNDRLVNHMNYLLESMESTVGLPGIFPRYRTSQPFIHQGPITFHNINVDKSVIGVINTGNVKQIDLVMDKIKIAGNDDLAKALKEFIEAVISETTLTRDIKNELIEQMTFLASQMSMPKNEQKKGIIKSVLSAIKDTISTISPLVVLWDKLFPFLQGVFF